ncbi:MAG: hypothetical protein C0609_07075 [Deltaproteobacteria bacterium]|nr:MAG: hypothetical protein C0609_07075 [Deltaproteobacteria bacterium]
MLLKIWAKPRASRTKIAGEREGALAVALAAPPVDGEANAELVKFFSKLLGASKKDVTVLKGATGRAKTLLVSGITTEEALKSLSLK